MRISKIFEVVWYRWLKRPIKLKKRIEYGQGSKTLVLLHGIADDADTWQPLVKQLNPKKWHVIGIDLLGFGRSPKPDWNDYNADDHVRAIMRTLKLKPRQKVVVVGHSMGCIIATHLAYQYPKKVSKLILYEPAFFSENEAEDSLLKNRKKLYFTVYEHIMNNPKMALFYGKLGSKMIRGLSHASINDDVWVPFERSLKNTILDQDSLEELISFDLPVEIIYGQFDIVVSKSNIDEILERKKNISFHKVYDMHGVSKRSARFITGLLDEK